MNFLLALALTGVTSSSDKSAEAPLVLRAYDISAAQPWGVAERDEVEFLPRLCPSADNDARGEVPEPQSREFWHALRTLGVDTQFVIYPAEGHHIAQPDHQRDIVVRMAGWFDKYLKVK